MVRGPRRPLQATTRIVALLAGILIPQVLLYLPSLRGDAVLLPLDYLAQDGVYLPQIEPWRSIVPHDALFSDEVEQLEVFRQLVVAEVREGRLPLWNPYVYAGAPLLASDQSAVFSPFRLPDYAFPGPRTHAWTALLKALVAGLGAYGFFRRALGVRHEAGAFGAWVFPHAGLLVAAGGYPLSSAYLWLPWELWAVSATLRRPASRAPLGLAVVTALLLLSGHLGAAAHVLTSGLVFAVWLGWRRRATLTRRSPAALAAGLGLGLLLAMPQVLPSLEYARASLRVASRIQGGIERLPAGPGALRLLVVPDFDGASRRGTLMLTRQNRIESAAAGYVGLLTALVAAPFAFSGAAARRAGAAFGAAAASAAAAPALGVPFPPPVLPFSLLRNNRLVFVAGFALLCLAVLGLEALRRRRVVRRPAGFAAVGLVLIGTACLLRVERPPAPLGGPLLAMVQDPGHRSSLPRALRTPEDVTRVETGMRRVWTLGLAWSSAGLAVLAVARRRPSLASGRVLGVLMCAEVVTTAHGVRSQCDPRLYYPPVPTLEALARAGSSRISGLACLPPDLAASAGLRDARGYDAADPADYLELLTLGEDPSSPPSPPHARSRNLVLRPGPVQRLLAVRYLVGRGQPPHGVSPAFASPDYWAVEVPALGRAFVPRRVEVTPERAELLRRLAAPDFDPAAVAYVDRAVPDLTASDPTAGAARITAETAARVEIEAELDRPGLVVLSDMFYPGWRAAVDGQAAEVLRTDHALRGVVVPAGRHRIEYRYEPRSLRWGLALAALGATIAGGAFRWLPARGRR